MKLSELKRALNEEFGVAYAGVLLRDYWLTELQMTGMEALERGAQPRDVWLAVCHDFQIARNRQYGRGLLEPKKD